MECCINLSSLCKTVKLVKKILPKAEIGAKKNILNIFKLKLMRIIVTIPMTCLTQLKIRLL